MSKVLCVGDTQIPFDHDDYLSFLKAVQKKYKTNVTVHLGDEIDNCAISDYDHDPDGFSAGHELQKAIDRLRPYYKAFPKMLICRSNHVERIIKRVMKAGIPMAHIKEFKDVIGAPPGWKWSDEFVIDGVCYIHGKGYSGNQGALNAAKDRGMSTVIGHLHADSGLLFYNSGKKTIFGLNVGCGIDPKAYAFAYGKDCRKKPVLSCGVVIDGEPHLIRMPSGR